VNGICKIEEEENGERNHVELIMKISLGGIIDISQIIIIIMIIIIIIIIIINFLTLFFYIVHQYFTAPMVENVHHVFTVESSYLLT